MNFVNGILSKIYQKWYKKNHGTKNAITGKSINAKFSNNTSYSENIHKILEVPANPCNLKYLMAKQKHVRNSHQGKSTKKQKP